MFNGLAYYDSKIEGRSFETLHDLVSWLNAAVYSCSNNIFTKITKVPSIGNMFITSNNYFSLHELSNWGNWILKDFEDSEPHFLLIAGTNICLDIINMKIFNSGNLPKKLINFDRIFVQQHFDVEGYLSTYSDILNILDDFDIYEYPISSGFINDFLPTCIKNMREFIFSFNRKDFKYDRDQLPFRNDTELSFSLNEKLKGLRTSF